MSDTTTTITKVLSSAGITLVESDFIQQLTLEVASGTCEVTGSGDFRAVASQLLTLVAGTSLTLTSKGPNAPFSGLTITAVAGTTNLVMSR